MCAALAAAPTPTVAEEEGESFRSRKRTLEEILEEFNDLPLKYRRKVDLCYDCGSMVDHVHYLETHGETDRPFCDDCTYYCASCAVEYCGFVRDRHAGCSVSSSSDEEEEVADEEKGDKEDE